MKTLHQILVYFYLLSVLFPFVIGCIRYNNLSKRCYTKIVWLLLLVLVVEIYNIVFQEMNNAWIINGYLSLEFTIISYIFYNSYADRRLQKLLVTLYFISIIFAIFNLTIIQKASFNSYSFILFSLIIIFFILEFIRQSLNTLSFTFRQDALFWFSIGGLLFYTGNILVTGFISEWIKVSMELATELYLINKILNIAYYILIGFGLFWDNQKNRIANDLR